MFLVARYFLRKLQIICAWVVSINNLGNIYLVPQLILVYLQFRIKLEPSLSSHSIRHPEIIALIELSARGKHQTDNAVDLSAIIVWVA